MKFIYPAVFRKNEEGKYKAFFPDLECCEAEGDTLEMLLTMQMKQPITGSMQR